MKTFVVRLRLPDRPGALGAVLSRIGSVGANVIGISILERSTPRVADQLVVEVPLSVPVELLQSEIVEVDGVEVHVIHEADGTVTSPQMHALCAAKALIEATSAQAVLDELAAHARTMCDATWVASRPRGRGAWVTAGHAPEPLLLDQLATGGSPLAEGADELFTSTTSSTGNRLEVMIGRHDAVCMQETAAMKVLADIAERRLGELEGVDLSPPGAAGAAPPGPP
ncbi:MAG: hypothetical protein JJLCMIEE_02096 [Acidimicrobiales bacterium]|nr:MAG: hypothetical protein EDR02_03270 [Actinomycetota bacterium]MBV6509029.1 hypothetical protein [Acidimicrobiales bacterium]RIK06260.1 MAG: hypothetical protein DCC48_07475 [Acidobacteriota bacterium]